MVPYIKKYFGMSITHLQLCIKPITSYLRLSIRLMFVVPISLIVRKQMVTLSLHTSRRLIRNVGYT
jgi:hypothetical protein